MSKYIICYDIKSSKRLIRVHNYLKKIAMPIQYSIFILEGDNNYKIECLDQLKNMINDKEDDLRCYILSMNLYQYRIGKTVLSDGIYLSTFPYGI